jgi:alkylhydroperoxidase family enzyme
LAINEETNSPLTERERVALDYTDRMMAYHGDIPDELMNRVKEHFNAEEIVALTFKIGLSNATNWFVIAMELER